MPRIRRSSNSLRIQEPARCKTRAGFCFALDGERPSRKSIAVKAFFVQIKCELGSAYKVATALADAEIASEIYSTAGDYDLLAKFYLEDGDDIGHFVNEKVHSLAGIRDTYTIITFRAF